MPETKKERKAITLDDHERQAAIVQEGKDLTGREDQDADEHTR